MFSLHKINEDSELLLSDDTLILVGAIWGVLVTGILTVTFIALHAPVGLLVITSGLNFLFGMLLYSIGAEFPGIYYTSKCSKSSLENIKIKHKDLRTELSKLEQQFEQEKASIIKAKEDEELFYNNLKDMKIGD